MCAVNYLQAATYRTNMQAAIYRPASVPQQAAGNKAAKDQQGQTQTRMIRVSRPRTRNVHAYISTYSITQDMKEKPQITYQLEPETFSGREPTSCRYMIYLLQVSRILKKASICSTSNLKQKKQLCSCMHTVAYAKCMVTSIKKEHSMGVFSTECVHDLV